MVEVHGRRLRVVPPAGARAFVADVTDWMNAPWPLEGPLELELPRGAYLEYAFLDERGELLPDPEAPAPARNPWRPYAAAVWTEDARPPEAPAGPLLGRTHRLRAGGRRLIVYEPPAAPAASLLVLDGVAYYRIAKLAHVAEALWREGRIAPLRLVFSEPEDRDREYRFDPALADHLLEEALSATARELGAAPPWGVWGASLGGLTALWLGLEHPEVFPRVAAQSPALPAVPGGRDARRDPEFLSARYAEADRGPERIALQVGRLEWLLAPVRRFAALLAERGTAHEYREYPSGHNWTTWRIGLTDGLVDLFGRDLDVR